MKRTLVALLALAFVAMIAMPTAQAAATKGSWSGWFSDDHCGAKGASADHKACMDKCMSKGGKLVFVNSADKKVYSVANPDKAKDHWGHEVKVAGSVDGTTLTIDSVEMPKSM
jgi:hypothetical protein